MTFVNIVFIDECYKTLQVVPPQWAYQPVSAHGSYDTATVQGFPIQMSDLGYWVGREMVVGDGGGNGQKEDGCGF